MIEINLVPTCQVDDDCTVLLEVIKNSGLETFLQEEGPLTLLAPTDAAFAQMEEAEVKALMNPENTDAARTFIYRHLIPASLEEAQLLAEPQPIWEEGTVVFSKKDGTLTINGINVVRTAVSASNGQVYFISEVLPDQASDI